MLSPGALGGSRGRQQTARGGTRGWRAPRPLLARGESGVSAAGPKATAALQGPRHAGECRTLSHPKAGRGVTALSVDWGKGVARHSRTNRDLTEGAEAGSRAQAWQAKPADPFLGQPGSSPFESFLGPSSPLLRVPWQPKRPAGPARAAGQATAGSDAFHLPSEGGVRWGCRGARAAWKSAAREARGDRDPRREPPTCCRRPRPGRHHGASAARPSPVRSRW